VKGLTKMPDFTPREGGVKVVFDVREAEVAAAERVVSVAGFEVRRYYRLGKEPRTGGAAAGWVRLGAERPMREFSEAESDRIVAAFDALQREAGFSCVRVATDQWTAGGEGGLAGDREPRRPQPRTGPAAAAHQL
jgi:hypothetical protein